MYLIKIGDWSLEVTLRSRHSFSHFKIHRYEMYKHLVWGRFSVFYGCPGLESIECCPYCYGEVVHTRRGPTYCGDGCGCIESEGALTLTMDEYESLT